MSATQIRRLAAAAPSEDRYWEQVYRRIRDGRQARSQPPAVSGAARRREIERRARQAIITLEDSGHRATDMTPTGLQIRSLRAGLNGVGAQVPAQPRSRAIERVTLPARITLR